MFLNKKILLQMSLRVEIEGIQRFFYYSQNFKWHWNIPLEIHIATLQNLVTIFFLLYRAARLKDK